jgi:hypothetical protein
MLQLAESPEHDGIEFFLVSWGTMRMARPFSLGWLSARDAQHRRGVDGKPHPDSDLVKFRYHLTMSNVTPRADGVYEGLSAIIESYVATAKGMSCSVWVHQHKLYGVTPELVR